MENNRIKQFFLHCVGYRFFQSAKILFNQIPFWFLMYIIMTYLYFDFYYMAYKTRNRLKSRIHYLETQLSDCPHTSKQFLK
jgi:hypothetical protein